MFPYEEYITGRTIQRLMIENADLGVFLAFGYLGMVKYGPAIARRVLGENKLPVVAEGSAGGRPVPADDPQWLRTTMILWNLFLSAFSFFGAIVMIPALFRSIAANGLHDTVCRHHEELNYSTPCGTWTGIFVVSKVPELFDTFLLIIQKKKVPPFLHWYHHVSVLLFAFMSYSLGNSTMPVFGSMNIFVHTIMYGYFMICAMGHKRFVRRYAKFITLLQISQMVGGSVLTFYSFVVNYNDYYHKGNDDLDTLPCHVNRQTAVFGALMYLSYLFLFSKMFVESYIKPKKPLTAEKKVE